MNGGRWANDTSGGSKGNARDASPTLGPISFNFMRFSAKILPNHRFLPHIQGLMPPVLEILDLPLDTSSCGTGGPNGGYSSFPAMHKLGKVGIFVQILMEINWKGLKTESVSMPIYICYGTLN